MELLKRENCALLMEREKLSAKLGGLTRGGREELSDSREKVEKA